MPSAHTLIREVDENAFASIVQARPDPLFGRPVRHRDNPYRLRPGASPQTLRIRPHDRHPVLRLPLAWQSSNVGPSPWLSPSFPTSCPFGVLLIRTPRPARHYPRLWIWRPSSRRQRDLNPPDSCAAQRTLWARPTPIPARPVPRGRPVGGHAPPPLRAARVASCLLLQTCRRHYPGGIAGGFIALRPVLARAGLLPSDVGLPRNSGGSASALPFSRPAQRSLTLRPACSPSRPRRPSTPKASAASLPPRLLRLLPAGATSYRAGFAPTEDTRLSTAH